MDETILPTDSIVDAVRALEPLVEFGPAGSEAGLAPIERRLGTRLPEALRSFLLASDGATIGVRLTSGELEPNAIDLVWSAAEIQRHLETNDAILPRPADVLFFAGAGADGILFGHPIRGDAGIGPDVVSWDPLEEGVMAKAPSFRAWVEGWLNGTLTV